MWIIGVGTPTNKMDRRYKACQNELDASGIHTYISTHTSGADYERLMSSNIIDIKTEYCGDSIKR